MAARRPCAAHAPSRGFHRKDSMMCKALRMAFALAAIGLLTTVSTGTAEQQKLVRIRGTIEKIDGPNLEVKARDGKTVKARMTDDVRFTAMVKASLKDLADDTYIGVTSLPQADGT